MILTGIMMIVIVVMTILTWTPIIIPMNHQEGNQTPKRIVKHGQIEADEDEVDEVDEVDEDEVAKKVISEIDGCFCM